MTLGINTATGGGDFLPIVKWNAVAGRLYRTDRTQNSAGDYVTEEEELKEGTSFVFDFGSIETGWALLARGMAPSWAMKPLGSGRIEPPTTEHREGFRMKVWNPNLGIRELAGTAKTMVGAIDELHTAFEGAPEAVAGQLPVVKFAGVTMIPIKTPKGTTTTYRPVLEITRWVDRAAEFGERTVPPPAPRLATQSAPADWGQEARLQNPVTQQVTATAYPSNTNPRHVPPPPPRQAPPPHRTVDEWGSAAAMPAPAVNGGKVQLEEEEIPF